MIRVRIGDDETEISWDEWERRVRAGRVPPSAMVHFEPVTGTTFVQADTLEMWTSLRDNPVDAWTKRLANAPPPIATAILVGIQIRLWWFDAAGDGGNTYRSLMNWASPIYEDGEGWRLLTSAFIHSDLGHIGMNGLFLAYSGWALERVLGWRNLVAIYAFTALAGSVASSLMTPEAPSLGSSGAVFGLMGAAVVFGFVRNDILPRNMQRMFGWGILPYAAVMFPMGFWNEGVDNWAHGGGLFAGMVAGFLLDPELVQRTKRWNLVWQAAAAVLVALSIALPWALGPRVEPLVEAPPPETDSAVTYAIPIAWNREVRVYGDSAFHSPTPGVVRSWQVREGKLTAAATPEELIAEWGERMVADNPRAQVGAPEPIELGGVEGLRSRAVLPSPVEGEDAVVVHHAVASRGRHTLDATWEVDGRRERRLAPLHARLMRSITWEEPVALADARRIVERTPESIEGRRALAIALAETGDTEEAIRIWTTLLEEHGDRESLTVDALVFIADFPEAVPEPDAWLADALTRHPVPAIWAEAAYALDKLGRPADARGLLELAWARKPGDRDIARMRSRLGLTTYLAGPDNRPWNLVYDPVTRAPRDPSVVADWTTRPIDLAAAAERGQHRVDARDALVAEVVAGPTDVDRIALPLTLLEGEAPADPDEEAIALRSAADALDTIAGGHGIVWLSDEHTERIRAWVAQHPDAPGALLARAAALDPPPLP